MNENILITGHEGFIGRNIPWGKSYSYPTLDIPFLDVETDEVEGIIHLASVSNKRLCEEYISKTIHSNIEGVNNVLEVAFRKKLWVLFISTYQITEQNLYGLSKLVGEEMCRIYHKKGLNVKILRLPIVYGMEDREDKIVTKFINQIRKGREPEVFTDEKFYFSYVEDVVRLIESEVNIINGGQGKKYSLHDLKKGIQECLKIMQ